MYSSKIHPSKPLAHTVLHYDYTRIDHPAAIQQFKNLPSFGHGLMFSFYTDRPILIGSNNFCRQVVPQVLVLCPIGSPIWSVDLPKLAFLRVIFRPGMMEQLFPRMSMHAFYDGNTDAALHLDCGLANLYEQMEAATSPLVRIQLLDRYLLKRLAWAGNHRSIFTALRKAVNGQPDRPATVQSVADKVGLSRQHLSRLARRQLGYSAQEALGVLRFNRTLAHLHSLPPPSESLSTVAYKMGYYDMAHFSHEFKRMVGISPGRYLKTIHQEAFIGTADEFSESGFKLRRPA